MTTKTLMRTSDLENCSRESTQPVGVGEIGRFISILKRHANQSGDARQRSRKVLVEYINFSPNSQLLINELIMTCIGMKCPERLDIAIDVLSGVGGAIANYAYTYLQTDIQQWSKLYPNEKFKPTDDYWYVLLRSVGKCSGNPDKRFQVLSMCQDEPARGVAESVVEGLADLGTPKAIAVLNGLANNHPDRFIQKLARELLEF